MKLAIRLIIILMSFGLLNKVAAQSPNYDDMTGFDSPWRQQGRLLTLVISKGNPIRIFVAGKEEAKIDLAQVKLTIRELEPYPGKLLQVGRDGDHFIISDSLDLKKATQLEIMTQFKDQSETFHFDLKSEKP